VTHDAVRGDDGEVLDQIRLTGVRATGFHGVLASERAQGQVFVADVVVYLDTRAAAVGDDLARTVDYGVLAERVAATLSSDPADLIETVAERIAAVALDEAAVQAVDVVLHKPSAPITVPFDDVAVVIHRNRTRVPVVVPVTRLAASEAPPEPEAALALPGAGSPATGSFEPASPAGEVADPDDLAASVPDEQPDADALLESLAAPLAAPASEPLASRFESEPLEAGSFEAGSFEAGSFEAEPLEPETQEVEADVEGAPLVEDEPASDPAAPDAPVVAEAAIPTLASEAVRERDRMDDIPASPVEVVLALGANVGDTQQTLRDAIAALDAIAEIDVVEVSPLARTAPVGGPEQDDYLNAVVLAHTTLSARELLHAAQDVEYSFGRERTVRWGPRTLDIDLIVYGSLTDVAEDLELPHPRAHERAFVLEPWSQVQPDAVLPGLGGGPVAQLAATAPDRTGIRWLALDWLGTEEQDEAPEAPSVPPSPSPVAAAPAVPAPAPSAPVDAYQPVEAPYPPATPVPAPADPPVPAAPAFVQRTSALSAPAPAPAVSLPPIDATRVAPIQSVPPQFAPTAPGAQTAAKVSSAVAPDAEVPDAEVPDPAPAQQAPAQHPPLPPTFQPTFPAVRPTNDAPPER
jgi:2-amino-4-hydroxy-6-hydroxymethyldihydropteridine diphosphokinase/dihydroneopterin aldolase